MASKRQVLAFILVIAIGLVLSSMTQFRLTGLPIGLSESVLLLSILLHLPLGNQVYGGNQPSMFVPILFLMLLASLPGYFITLTSEGNLSHAFYNLAASSYVVFLFTYLHFGFNYKLVSMEQLAKIFLLFSVLYFLVILVLIGIEPTMVFIQDEIEELTISVGGAKEDLTEPIFRLYGFSSNPNQLALHAVVCTFFSVRLWKVNKLSTSVLCVLVSIVVGLLTRSDAYIISAIALMVISVVMGIIYRRSVVYSLVVLVPMIVGAIILFQPVYNYATEVAGYADQDETRMRLWRHGVEAGLERPLFGLGPGAWSGFEGPGELEESHNSAIDYFTNAGLFGLSIFLFGALTLTFKTIAAGQSTLLAGLAAIVLFAMFHNVLRQPIMWFALYYIAHSVLNSSNATRVRRRKKRPRSSGQFV